MDDGMNIRNDGYLNIFSGVGTSRDTVTQTTFRKDQRLMQTQLEDLFESDGLGRRICEAPAEDMTREWFTVDGDEGEAVLDALEVINAQEVFTEAVTWSRLYGGSAILLVTEDSENFESPLREQNFDAIKGLKAFDRYSITADMSRQALSKDPLLRLEGLPEFYLVNRHDGTSSPQFVVHESRLMRITGRRMPAGVRRNELEGWGGSTLQACYTSLTRYGGALGYTANIMRDFVQAVLAVKGLTSMIASGKEDVVQRRLQLLDLSRSLLNAMVIDADGETYDKKANSVAGMADLLDRFIENISACTGIPVTKLVGRAPGGLNSTGEHDMGSYYDMLAGEQARLLTPLAERLVGLVYRSRSGPTGGAEPDAWSIRWNSFHQPTDKEVAELRKSVADTDKIYVDAGVLSPEEVAESRWGQGAWSMETILATDTERNPVASMDPADAAALAAETAVASNPPAEKEARTDFNPNQPRDETGKWSPDGTRANPMRLSPYNQNEGNLDEMVAAVETAVAKGNLARHVKQVKVSWLEVAQDYLTKYGGGDPVFPDIPEKYWELPVVVKTTADGRYTILDGHHRLAKVYEQNKDAKVEVLLFEAKGKSRAKDSDDSREDYDPSQPRDNTGKWTASGRGASVRLPRQPRAGTSTGRVWEIGQGMKNPSRAALIRKSVAAGVQPGTAATQASAYLRARREVNENPFMAGVGLTPETTRREITPESLTYPEETMQALAGEGMSRSPAMSRERSLEEIARSSDFDPDQHPYLELDPEEEEHSNVEIEAELANPTSNKVVVYGAPDPDVVDAKRAAELSSLGATLSDLGGGKAVVTYGMSSVTIEVNGTQGDITRRFKFDPRKSSVDHSYFRLYRDQQGQGTGKKLFRESVQAYDRMGVTEITVHANIDVGGYSWAKYGYVPDEGSWRYLSRQLDRRIVDNPNRFGAAADSLRKLTASPDPTAIWSIADSAHGKELLLGTDWYGQIDLTKGSRARQRMAKYVGLEE